MNRKISDFAKKSKKARKGSRIFLKNSIPILCGAQFFPHFLTRTFWSKIAKIAFFAMLCAFGQNSQEQMLAALQAQNNILNFLEKLLAALPISAFLAKSAKPQIQQHCAELRAKNEFWPWMLVFTARTQWWHPSHDEKPLVKVSTANFSSVGAWRRVEEEGAKVPGQHRPSPPPSSS